MHHIKFPPPSSTSKNSMCAKIPRKGSKKSRIDSEVKKINVRQSTTSLFSLMEKHLWVGEFLQPVNQHLPFIGHWPLELQLSKRRCSSTFQCWAFLFFSFFFPPLKLLMCDCAQVSLPEDVIDALIKILLLKYWSTLYFPIFILWTVHKWSPPFQPYS